VRWRGLEPPRLAAHGPQPCLSANSSTSAKARRIIIVFMTLSSKDMLYRFTLDYGLADEKIP